MSKISQNLQNIISNIGSQDLLGGNPTEIDSYKEYNLLGQYLNGSYVINNSPIESLSKKELKNLKQILTSLKEKWGELTNAKAPEEEVITKDNVKEYLSKYSKLISLREAGKINNEPIERLEKMMFNFLKQYEFPYAGNEYNSNKDYRWMIEQEVLPILDMLEEGKRVKTVFQKEQDKSALQRAVEKYNKSNNIPISNPENVDIGDGDFDEKVIQKSDVCPFLAGINSLANGKGKILLEKNMYRDPDSGVYAIHLQEAEDCGLPSNGVYIITPQEIIDAKDTIAEGEGDSVAYLLAIDKYFKELHKEKPDLAEKFDNSGLHTGDIKKGNYNTRFFNIITGVKTTEIDINSYQEAVPLGINMGSRISYFNLSDIIKEERGAAVLSIISGAGPHAISVVGVNDKGLLIQESNNNSELFLSQYGTGEDDKQVFKQVESIDGVPTYLLTREFYNKAVHSTSLIRWE